MLFVGLRKFLRDPPFKRGARVGRPPSGPEDNAIPERHDASDLD